ncbi:MAG TPA: class I SAM-dependent methyltransferase [Kofleriaceae bacterium]|nr:class I SAM-dependent methyltransferase [Kofleriaceae bacterium]
MKAGRESQTAVLVCQGRALAQTPEFRDPTAYPLLPDEARGLIDRIRAGERPRSMRERLRRLLADRQSKVMVARTVAIDRAVGEAGAPQLVILGAGLDGRAWRMPELRDVVVFEVDHPDSQAAKRARAAALAPVARDVRFVPVDFERDRLDDELARAGHDPARPTTWIWEGVVMYLAPADVEATLAVVARRSAPASRLLVLYHCPSILLGLVGAFVRRLGEPLRSAFSAEQMRALLARHGFTVVRDEDLRTIGATMSRAVRRGTRPIRHMRIVTADRKA